MNVSFIFLKKNGILFSRYRVDEVTWLYFNTRAQAQSLAQHFSTHLRRPARPCTERCLPGVPIPLWPVTGGTWTFLGSSIGPAADVSAWPGEWGFSGGAHKAPTSMDTQEWLRKRGFFSDSETEISSPMVENLGNILEGSELYLDLFNLRKAGKPIASQERI